MGWGYKHTEEAKRKISELKKGKHRGCGNPFFGKKHSIESRRKMSESSSGEKHNNWGKHPSLETRKKLSRAKSGKNHPMFGKHHTEEAKRNQSEKQKGKIISPETRKKLSKALKGKIKSLEHRINMSKSQKGKHVGENSVHWRGGLSFMPYSPEFTEQLKELIRKRDNYRCRECFKPQNECGVIKCKPKALCVHHIDYCKLNSMPNNLISLCDKCHMKTNYNRKYWTEYFQKKVV